MKALLVVPAAVLAASLGFLVASCGANGDANSAGPVPSVGTTTNDTTEEVPDHYRPGRPRVGTETEPSSAKVTYQVWFTSPEGSSSPIARALHRRASARRRWSRSLEGPDSFERGLRPATADPRRHPAPRPLDRRRHRARRPDPPSSSPEETPPSMQPRLAQVVYTITQFPTVKGVLFSLDGEPIDVLPGGGSSSTTR